MGLMLAPALMLVAAAGGPEGRRVQHPDATGVRRGSEFDPGGTLELALLADVDRGSTRTSPTTR